MRGEFGVAAGEGRGIAAIDGVNENGRIGGEGVEGRVGDEGVVVVGEVEEVLHDEMVGLGVGGGELGAKAAVEIIGCFHAYTLFCSGGVTVEEISGDEV